jgi:hypothetical protein
MLSLIITLCALISDAKKKELAKIAKAADDNINLIFFIIFIVAKLVKDERSWLC